MNATKQTELSEAAQKLIANLFEMRREVEAMRDENAATGNLLQELRNTVRSQRKRIEAIDRLLSIDDIS